MPDAPPRAAARCNHVILRPHGNLVLAPFALPPRRAASSISVHRPEQRGQAREGLLASPLCAREGRRGRQRSAGASIQGAAGRERRGARGVRRQDK
eukprot:10857051-Alexandrium_andersonii.AAC.1